MDVVDDVAKRLFDNQPHKHPQSRTPQWDLQPDSIKNVFRKIAEEIVP